MNNFLKDLMKLATELNQANEFDAVVVINEMELLYDKHIAELKNLAIHNISTCTKLRKALETIRDAFYTDGETDKEKVDDLKSIAFNVLYEIDNNIEVE